MKKIININLITKLIIIFFIGAFVGWLYELIFYYFTENRLTNSGALYGPWLPIYGTGSVLICFLKPLKKHPIILFLTIMLLTGILEYIVGYVLLEFFQIRLWDYRGLFLSINGFVCLRSVITFAIGGIALVYLIEPFIKERVPLDSKRIQVILIILAILFITDIVISDRFREPYRYELKDIMQE